MTHLQLSMLLYPAVLSFALQADAAPVHNVCVPAAVGVPTRPGAPTWFAWPGAGAVDTSLDDPRWNQATAHSFEAGSATAPLHARAVWSNVGGQEYLYLSFISDLAPNPLTPRDIFLGFRRATPDTHATPDTSDDEYGYMFQIHLGAGGHEQAHGATYCGKYDSTNSCVPADGNVDWWRMFIDRNDHGTCGATAHLGHLYKQWNGGGPGTPPIAWMNNSIHAWKYDASDGPMAQNRWAVQMRIKIAPSAHSITEGIESGSLFWYEATESVAAGTWQSLTHWPDTTVLSTAICPNNFESGDFLIHEELGSVDPTNCPLCSPDKFSAITDVKGARPDTCDAGVAIYPHGIGAVFDNPGPYDTISLTNSIKAYKSPGVKAANTLVAQVENTGPAVNTAIKARFRIANWGSTPFTQDTWTDIRGQGSGITGVLSIPTGGKKALSFNWTLGGDATLGDSELCSYGITPTGSSCQTCTCTGAAIAGTDLCPASTTGTQVPGAAVCLKLHSQHQCMHVELSAPNGDVNFTQASAYNNMGFAQMSSVAREAMIDARGLPRRQGQQYQDIYLIAMARNMPKAIPGGAPNGASYLRERALVHAEKLSAPYHKDLGRLSKEELARKLTEIAVNRPLGFADLPMPRPPIILPDLAKYTERINNVYRPIVIMPHRDRARVENLLEVMQAKTSAEEMTRDLVRKVGPEAAAGVVPTLEIYPFYRPLDAGNAYLPMTAFTVFLSHEGAMRGMTWQLDGATQVGQNVYHLRIPVGFARKIQVRAQAIEANEPPPQQPDPKWPCAGCCAPKNCGLVAQVGNSLPALFASCYVVLRRRRRRPS